MGGLQLILGEKSDKLSVCRLTFSRVCCIIEKKETQSEVTFMAVELTKAGLEARRKYMREWQRKNRERKRDMENRRWNRIGEQMEAEEAAKRQKQGDTNTGSVSDEQNGSGCD